ncbi:MAG: pseudoazurin [Rhodobacteraceae bacterium]|nr:pseudoazurin [Paracoccaceae bacterium]
MKMTRRENLALLGGTLAAATVPGALMAADEPKTVIVEMLNVDPDDKKQRQIFKPAVVHVNVGDTVKFVPTDRGHNAEVDKKMMPEGGDEFAGKINKEVEVTFTTDGAYGYYCKPHRSVGMVGLVLVGDAAASLEAAKEVKQRGKAKQRYKDYFAQADEILAEAQSS